jgi:integrase
VSAVEQASIERFEPTSLLTRQLAVRLRPEFAAEVIVPAVGDPILGTPACGVPRCVRPVMAGGLCTSHYRRRRHEGYPDLEEWTATTDPATRGHRPLQVCAVTGCGRGVLGAGLCTKHHYRWTRMLGRPDLAGWLATVVDDPDERPACAVDACALLVESADPGLCRSHYNRWRGQGRPPLRSFVLECATYGDAVFDLRALPAAMRLEVAYGLQCRVDDHRAKTPAKALRPLLGLLAASGASSLLERPPDEWLAELTPVARWGNTPRSFVRFTIEQLDDLLQGEGWQAEFGRDVWLLRRLGYPRGTGPARLRFDRIGQPWLRELVKRWARWRLSAALSAHQVERDVAALTRLSAFLAACEPELRGAAGLDRPVLERYLAWLAVEQPRAKGRSTELGSVAGFLRGVHQHLWAPELPATAAIYREDRPRRPKNAPRALSEHVMAQLESPANLARFTHPGYRLLTEILMRTGLRISDACGLAIDCLLRDPGGAAYLRYRNHKMRREAFVPVDEALAEAIGVQQAAVVDGRRAATRLFPRPHANPDGTHPVGRGTYIAHLDAWLRACDVRDELGRPVHVTPHQWRHTYGTRLVNADVPLEVVRRLLDHTSLEMTAHYGRIHDSTVREHWERARKVNIAGEDLLFDPASPLADATWLKDRLARAKMALPNGYCTLPPQQRCEVANACLTCPMFATTVEFLPQHHQQLAATRQLIDRAQDDAQERMVEMNRTVEGNLLRIITSLETPGDSSTSTDDSSTQGAARAG